MATLDQILADVTAESSDIQSISVLVKGLRAQLADVLAGVLPADVQAKVDAIFAKVEENKAAIAAAVAATPDPAPTPAVDPVPAPAPTDPAPVDPAAPADPNAPPAA